VVVTAIKKNKISLLFKAVFSLLVIIFSISILTELSTSATTTVYVYPSSTTVTLSQTFFVDIRISAVSDLYGWEFKLKWDPNLLDVVDVTEGPFLKQGGSTFFTRTINNTIGYILVDCTLLGSVPGVSGNGTLASVKFYAEKEGSSVLDLYDTKLVNSQELPISHTANDGSVTISKSVGGIIVPLSKLELLAPWIGLVSTIAFSIFLIAVFVKRRKKIG